MKSGRSVFFALVAAMFLWLASGAVGDSAQAQCGNCKPPPTCNTCQVVQPPPNCCKPAPPPVNQTCCSPNHNVYVPGVNVYVAPSVVVNANVNASINLTAINNNYNNNNNNNTNNQTNNNNNNGGGTPGGGGGDNSNTNVINNVITATSSSVSNASSISNSSATGGAGGIGIGIGGGSGGGGGGGTTNVYAYGGNATASSTGGSAAGGSATAYAYGSAFSGSISNSYGSGGGGQMFFTPPMATGYIQGLTVEGPERRQKVAYEATRTTTRRVIIQAFCLDDRDVPHPASQLSPDREIGDYEGEIFRCIAGTRLQYVVAEFKAQQASCLATGPGGGPMGASCFNGGQTIVCNKSDSLYYSPNGKGGGALSCRPQKPARDCNERSLLRRFGAGVKILTILSEERYTDYREEVVREQTSVVSNLALDGGVGGVAY